MENNPMAASFDSDLPSRTTSRPWIYAHDCVNLPDCSSSSGEEEEDIVYESRIGKWLLFNDIVRICETKGMTEHDYAWKCVKGLVERGLLHSAKCSTAWGKEDKGTFPDSSNGVICCYTKDYSDKQDVKKAADAIRSVYHFPRDMFYKTDRDTYAGKYRHSGDKYVSIYKHTMANEMYERDDVVKYKWNLVNV